MRSISVFVYGVALVSLAMAGVAPARTIFPGHGSGGDRSDTDECPAGSALAGFGGRVGSWLDQLRIICAPMNGDGSFARPSYYGPPRGGPNGTPAEFSCPTGTILKGAVVQYTEDRRQVKGIFANCITSGGQYGGTISIQGGARAEDTNYEEPTESSRPICPSGESAIGLVINSGMHVNEASLICDSVATASGAPVTATVNPPGYSPIKKTGKAIPEAPLSAFVGTWNTVTSQDGHYLVTIVEESTGYFTGTFVNQSAEHQYDGTLHGRIIPDTRTLNGTYQQPGIKGRGLVSFDLSRDGNSLTGRGTHMAKTHFEWNGTRSSPAQ